MSTTPAVRPAPTIRLLKPTTTADRVSFSRLTLVEARKFVDTRAGLWLLGIGLALSVAIAAGSVILYKPLTEAMGAGWLTIAALIGTPVTLLVPVMVILLFTSEWTQRTSLTTFTLEPRRGRVLLAKGVVAAAVTVSMWLMQHLVGAAGAAAGGAIHSVDVNWTIDWSLLLGTLATLALSCAMAAGFGMLMMNSPAAIVTYIAVPQVLGLLSFAGDTVAKVLAWITLGDAATPLLTGEWARWDGWQLAVSVLLWVVIPIVAGVIRTRRIEAK